MSNDKRRRASVGHLEAAFGVSLEPELLQRALTHRSYAYENGGLPTNERLEFLGDSVLGVVITTALFHNHPDLPEGQLAKLRASVVNMRALADVARGLGPDGLGAYLLLGKGEETTGGRDKASILADTLEALLGAIYLQYGLDTTGIVIHRLFDPLMAESAGRGAALDWKTSLQELTAALGLGVPEYRIEGTGPDHLKTFTAWVVVAGNRYGGAEGRSKKEAEQRAAEAAWRTLAEQNGQNGDDGQDGRAGDGRQDQPVDRGGSADSDEPFGPLERAERAAQAEQSDHLAQALPAGGADGHETGSRGA
ncbi:ribonuclease III [Micromonospora sp. LAH09]|uniref:ribonuclease III n=1 Tax=Micromonospora cabrerizensis TaxID=2911213 RepID=UPI001EE8D34B|nr:ribonuclease III [Micromonospora cabrerizensis]MCG5471330.1 ribonuclease III [Micromonospora cabrerizensis]